MAEDKQSGSGPNGNSIILFLIAAVSAVYVGLHGPSLISTRPTDSDYKTHDLRGVQDVEARLWQDPFAAVNQDLESGNKGNVKKVEDHSPREFFEGKDGKKILLLGITLPGAPYPETAETRRRLRYAVLAALHTAGYFPEDEQHIGYLKPNEDGKPSDTETLAVVTAASASIAPETGKSVSSDGLFNFSVTDSVKLN